jgi:hypothetical protein
VSSTISRRRILPSAAGARQSGPRPRGAA